MTDEIKATVEAGLASLGAQIKSAMEKHDAEMKASGKVSTELTGKIDELAEQYKSLRNEFADLAQKQTPAQQSEPVNQSAGQEFIKSEAYKLMAEQKSERARVELKAVVVSDATTTMPVQNTRVIQGSFIPRTIRGQIPTINVSGNSVNSLRELAWTNNAAEVAEAAAKPESILTFEQYDVPIRTIAHWIKVSNQLLADAPAIASYIDTRLRDGLAQRVEQQLLLGNGTAPNLSGLTDAGNFTAFTAASGANLVESINAAKYNRWALGETVDTVIVNPADWAAMEVLREGDGTGAYLYGAPGTQGSMSPFGVDVVISPYMPAGNFLIGSLRQSAVIYQRQGATVEMGYVNDDFTKNLVTIRAEERLGLAVDRPVGIMYGPITAA